MRTHASSSGQGVRSTLREVGGGGEERRGPADVTNVTREHSELFADTCSFLLDSHADLDFCLRTLHACGIPMLCHSEATPTPALQSGVAVYPRSSVLSFTPSSEVPFIGSSCGSFRPS